MQSVPDDTPTEPTPPAARQSGVIVWLVVICIIALSLRLMRFGQSLWCDEMGTLLEYAAAPWQVVVAPGPGQYVPNDHVLYSILAKLCLLAGNGGRVDPADTAAALIRLPSLLAGTLLPLAVAWPLRRSAPRAAVLLAILLAVHPWFIAESTEARGYGLMLLLGVLATNYLPGKNTSRPVVYGLLVAGMIYAVSVSMVLLIAHGVFVLVRRDGTTAWSRGAAVGLVLATLLYLPMARGVVDYYHHPLSSPENYGQFVNDVPRFALAGQYLPRVNDAVVSLPDPFTGWGYWLAPVITVGVALLLGNRKQPENTFLSVMAIATVLALIVPIALPAAGQVRFFPWSGAFLCVAFTSILLRTYDRFGLASGLILTVCVAGWMLVTDFQMPPDQPVREAVMTADRLAPAGTNLCVAFLTADGVGRLYSDKAKTHSLQVAATPSAFFAAERRAVQTTGRLPWLVVSYENLVHDFSPESWAELNRRYRLIERSIGRVTAVAIYAPVNQ